jgi:hypothetical protein
MLQIEEEEEEDLVGKSNCEAPHYAVTSTPLGDIILRIEVHRHNAAPQKHIYRNNTTKKNQVHKTSTFDT